MFNVARILDKHEYQEFIIESLHPDITSISDHLFSNYQLHKSVNHKFCEIISKEIQKITTLAEEELKIHLKKSVLNGRIKSTPFILTDIDKVNFNIPKDKIAMPYYQQRKTSINVLNQEYLKFMSLIELDESTHLSNIKINWNKENKQHLYFILKELKACGIITNSFTDLAKFVKQNFPLYAKDSESLLRDRIKAGRLPSRGSLVPENIMKDIDTKKKK